MTAVITVVAFGSKKAREEKAKKKVFPLSLFVVRLLPCSLPDFGCPFRENYFLLFRS
jgi:hypothetical protein